MTLIYRLGMKMKTNLLLPFKKVRPKTIYLDVIEIFFGMRSMLSVRKNISRSIFLSVFFLLHSNALYPNAAKSKETIDINEKLSIVNISKNISFYHDKTGRLTLSDIKKEAIQNQFELNQIQDPIFPVSSDYIWGKFKVYNHNQKHEKYLFINYYFIDQLHFFIPGKDGKVIEFKSGKGVANSEKAIPDRMQIIPLDLPDGYSDIYFRISPQKDNFEFPAYITDAMGLVSIKSKSNSFLAIFGSITLVLVIINFIIFLVIKDRSYLYYIIHSATMIIIFLWVYGIPQYWLFPTFIQGVDLINLLGAHISLFASLLFVIHFLEIKKKSLKMFYTLKSIFIASFGNVVLLFFAPIIANQIFYLVLFISCLLVIGFSISDFKKNIFSRYYLFAWSLYLTLLILYSLAVFKIINLYIRLPYVVSGNALEALILSFALGQKFKIIIQEKGKIEKKLVIAEKQVIEHLKNTEAEREQLAALNREMEIGSNIQKSLFPKTLPNNDFIQCAAGYSPANTIGGDFYMAIYAHDGWYFLMVDVMGHGIGSALVASMIKSAAESALLMQEKPDLILKQVASIVTAGQSALPFTAVLLKIDPAAKKFSMVRAGHPPIFRINRHEKSVTQLLPSGRIMGVISDLNLTLLEGDLVKGDRFFLYTDGLTEAVDRNMDPFEKKELNVLIEKTCGMKPGEMIKSFKDSLRNFTQSVFPEDDVTMLVVDITV